jgi:RloB-like protein
VAIWQGAMAGYRFCHKGVACDMAQNNQPKHRQQARDLRRHSAKRQPIERLLIVCEGSKTEPNYLNEIRQDLRLPTANVLVLPSQTGTDPLNVIAYAETLFLHGDAHKGISAKQFDRVYAVFDRDDHHTYAAALAKANALHLRLKNDEQRKVPFEAIASVPCFELWLLLHFEDVQATVHREVVYERLEKHLPHYQKGQQGHWASTKAHLASAHTRATDLAARHTAQEGVRPYTHMHALTQCLLQLKK